MERDIELRCAGQRVAMNRFTKSVLLGILLGLLQALKGVDAEAELSLRIGPAKK